MSSKLILPEHLRQAAKAEVTEEQPFSIQSEESRAAYGRLSEAGLILAPGDYAEYLGSMAVHLYQKTLADPGGPVYFTACQCKLGHPSISEGFADQAVKRLSIAAMKHWGRTPPRKRKG